MNACPATAILATVQPRQALGEAIDGFCAAQRDAASAAAASDGLRAQFAVTQKYATVPERKGLEPAAFGIFVCNAYLPAVPAFDSAAGTHTHGDGVIHIHPFDESAAGDNARLGVFLAGAHIQVTANEILVGEDRYGAGDTCRGKPIEIELVRWADVAADAEPEIVLKNGAELRFQADGEGYALAAVPAGVGVPKPPAAGSLAALGAADS